MYGTHEIIMYNNTIYVPQPLREQMLNWYHHYLSHTGATRLTKTVQQSYDLLGLVADCVCLITKFTICKKIRNTDKPKYDKLSVKVVEATPLVEVNIDLICPYMVKTHKNKCQWYSNNIDFTSNYVY